MTFHFWVRVPIAILCVLWIGGKAAAADSQTTEEYMALCAQWTQAAADSTALSDVCSQFEGFAEKNSDNVYSVMALCNIGQIHMGMANKAAARDYYVRALHKLETSKADFSVEEQPAVQEYGAVLLSKLSVISALDGDTTATVESLCLLADAYPDAFYTVKILPSITQAANDNPNKVDLLSKAVPAFVGRYRGKHESRMYSDAAGIIEYMVDKKELKAKEALPIVRKWKTDYSGENLETALRIQRIEEKFDRMEQRRKLNLLEFESIQDLPHLTY